MIFGEIIVIRRDGADSSRYPLRIRRCVFGDDEGVDIRVRLPTVDSQHCILEVQSAGRVTATNQSQYNPTLINEKPLHTSCFLDNQDVITIGDRKFRFEYPAESQWKVGKFTPLKKSPAVVKTPLSKKKIISKPHTGPRTPLISKPQVKTIHRILSEIGKTSPNRSPKSPDPLKQMSSNLPIVKSATSPKRKHSPVVAAKRSPLSAKKPKLTSPKGTKERYAPTPARPMSVSPNVQIVKHYRKSLEVASRYKQIPTRTSVTPIKNRPSFKSPNTSVRTSTTPAKKVNSPAPARVKTVTPTVYKSPIMTPRSATPPKKSRSSRSPSKSTNKSPRISKASSRLSDASPVGPLVSTKRKQQFVTKGTYSEPASKRKRVSFGPQLSPQQFDKNMPPSTPLKRGAMPPRKSAAKSEQVKKLVREMKKSSTPFNFTKSLSPRSSVAKLLAKSTPNPFSPSRLQKNNSYTPATGSTRVSVISLPPTPDSNLLDSNASQRTFSLSPSSAKKSPANKMAYSAPNTPATKMSPTNVKKLSKSAKVLSNKAVVRAPTVPFSSPVSVSSSRNTPIKNRTSLLSPKKTGTSIQSPTRSLSPSSTSSPRSPRSTVAPIRYLVDLGEHLPTSPVKIISPRKSVASPKSVSPKILSSRKSEIPPSKKSNSPTATPSGQSKRTVPSPIESNSAKKIKTTPQRSKTPLKRSWASVVKQKNVPIQRVQHLKSKTPMKAVRKTPAPPKSAKKTWASIVMKKNVPIAKSTVLHARQAISKARKVAKPSSQPVPYPKTPREKYGAPSTTGHIQSPETIVLKRQPVPNPKYAAPIFQHKFLVRKSYQQNLNRKSMKLEGVRRLMKPTKTAKTPSYKGVSKLMKSPKPVKSPSVKGVRELVKTPKAVQSPALKGVRELVKSPKPSKSPVAVGIRELVNTPKPVKSPALKGLRELVKTPLPLKSPRFGGMKEIFKSPIQLQSPVLIGVRHLARSPKMSISPSLDGVAKMLTSPAVSLKSKSSTKKSVTKSSKRHVIVKKSPLKVKTPSKSPPKRTTRAPVEKKKLSPEKFETLDKRSPPKETSSKRHVVVKKSPLKVKTPSKTPPKRTTRRAPVEKKKISTEKFETPEKKSPPKIKTSSESPPKRTTRRAPAKKKELSPEKCKTPAKVSTVKRNMRKQVKFISPKSVSDNENVTLTPQTPTTKSIQTENISAKNKPVKKSPLKRAARNRPLKSPVVKDTVTSKNSFSQKSPQKARRTTKRAAAFKAAAAIEVDSEIDLHAKVLKSPASPPKRATRGRVNKAQTPKTTPMKQKNIAQTESGPSSRSETPGKKTDKSPVGVSPPKRAIRSRTNKAQKAKTSSSNEKVTSVKQTNESSIASPAKVNNITPIKISPPRRLARGRANKTEKSPQISKTKVSTQTKTVIIKQTNLPILTESPSKESGKSAVSVTPVKRATRGRVNNLPKSPKADVNKKSSPKLSSPIKKITKRKAVVKPSPVKSDSNAESAEVLISPVKPSRKRAANTKTKATKRQASPVSNKESPLKKRKVAATSKSEQDEIVVSSTITGPIKSKSVKRPPSKLKSPSPKKLRSRRK